MSDFTIYFKNCINIFSQCIKKKVEIKFTQVLKDG